MLEGGEVVIPCEVGNRVGTGQWVKDGFAYVIQESKCEMKYDLCQTLVSFFIFFPPRMSLLHIRGEGAVDPRDILSTDLFGARARV